MVKTRQGDEYGGDPNKKLLGSNQSGMRAHNERLVLTLVRRSRALPKAEIARMTGLSPQTVSVIVRAMEAEGFLKREQPTRGRVGQPSVPMSLAAEGAYFFGLKVGRRSSELVLIDFLGDVVGRRQHRHAYPTPDDTLAFVKTAWNELCALLTPAQRSRIAGLGVATPFELWNWADLIGAPREDMDKWRDADLARDLEGICGCDIFVRNDGSAACGAELVFGRDDNPRDFLYFYIGFFAGGGVVLNGGLYTGATGNAGALGSILVPDRLGVPRQLIETASIATLERRIRDSGGDPMVLWAGTDTWPVDDAVLEPWIREVGHGLAFAIVASTAMMDFGAALVDGWLPDDVRARIVAATKEELSRLNLSGIRTPVILEGTVGADARPLGAASLPLSERYLLDVASLPKV